MRFRELVQVALMILGIAQVPYVVARSTELVSTLFYIAQSEQSEGFSLLLGYTVATVVLFWIVVLFVIFGSSTLARILVRNDRPLDWSRKAGEQLIVACCTTVGIVFVAIAAIELLTEVLNTVGLTMARNGAGGLYGEFYAQRPPITVTSTGRIARTLAQLAVGFGLIAGKRRIASTWRTLRRSSDADAIDAGADK